MMYQTMWIAGMTLSLAMSGFSAALVAQETPEFTQEQLDHFENKIRPILVARCAECHGKEAAQAGGGLLITSRGSLLLGGDTGPVIAPGNADESLLVQAIRYDGDYEMPPDSKMPAEEIALIEAWINDGAAWPSHDEDDLASTREVFDVAARRQTHWCWKPIRIGLLPDVKQKDWGTDPIDRFILAKLEAAGIEPAAEADRHEWLRRVTFDLTGLPPSVEQWEAFRDDDSAEAYERVVDRLLDSPQYGERWARHWLDLMRYAETCGHEFDYPIPHAFQYRDYVIRALNQDVPYDQFVTEHLAGDLLNQPRLHPERQFNESIIGTGFWYFGEATHAPVDVKGDEAGRVDNQLDVMTKSFLGLTVACARCHDHKFDAISTKDYYALSGFLQSSRRQEAMLDPDRKISAEQTRWLQINAEGSALLNQALQNGQVREKLKHELSALTRLYSGQAVASLDPAVGRQLQELMNQSNSEGPQADIELADFEDGTYGQWVAEGNAFGSAPQEQATLPDYQGNVGAHGRFFVNSHARRANDGGNSDDAVGTLTSPEFVIERRYLHFLVGGGPHEGRTCVQVLIDDQVVAAQTGFAQNAMRGVTLDLKPWLGRTARIRMVDQERGGWGNIGADHFVLSDAPRPGEVVPDHRLTATLLGLSEERVAAWQTALESEVDRPLAHPMGPLAMAYHRWKQIPFGESLADAAKTEQGFQETLAQLAQRRVKASQANQQWLDQSIGLFDATDPSLNQLYRAGQAFEFAEQTPAWRFNDQWSVVSDDVVSSYNAGANAWGVVHSPEFTIDGNTIWYLIRGADVELRLVIDSYTMHIYSGLLFSDLSKRIDTQGNWQWVAQAGDLSRYQGHRAHFEIIDRGGRGFELAAVRMSGGARPAEAVSSMALEIAAASDQSTLWSERYAEHALNALDRVAQGNAHRDDAALVSWLIGKGLIELDADQTMGLAALADQAREANGRMSNPMIVQAMLDGSGEDESIFVRGNHRLLGEVATRRDLEAICEGEWPQVAGSGRLEWARSITSPDHPLTSRVIVNRLWHHLFGRGIVATVDNFGVLGAEPSHPELLDHLAITFMDDGWSLKRMLKRMVLSRTYRQSSHPNALAEERDPTNSLWHRMEVRRLTGEAIRDGMLAVSGRIDLNLYGPSVPIHLTEFMQGRGRPGASGPEDGARRRSIYIEVRRNFLSPMMLAFDTPIPFSSVGRRNTSNVPAQALILLNDPFVHHEAEHWAKRLIDQYPDAQQRLTRAFLEAFTREPSPQDRERIAAFLDHQGAELGIAVEERSNHWQLWTGLCHALWNTKEFSYVK